MITPDLLAAWGNARGPGARITRWLAGRLEITPRVIAADTTISPADRLWVLCRCLGYLNEAGAQRFAIESAARVAHLAGDEDDQAQHLGLLNALLQIEDLPAEHRAAARDAVRITVEAAAWDAARATVAQDTIRDVAWASAKARAWEAARDATRCGWFAAETAASAAAGAHAWADAREPAWTGAWPSAWRAAMEDAIKRALTWLGDYANGWEEP